jgi:hypothetical protein
MVSRFGRGRWYRRIRPCMSRADALFIRKTVIDGRDNSV